MVQPGCEDSDPTADVSYATDIYAGIFDAEEGPSCSCHRRGAPGGFNLGSYINLRSGGNNSGSRIIVPGKPCDSLLVQKLGFAPPFGARMPYNGPPYLDAVDVRTIMDWIAEGAKDN